MKKKIVEKRSQKIKQREGWLSRYDFAYAGRDTVSTGLNTVIKIAPRTIQNTTNQVDKVAKKRIAQAISQGGKEVKRVAAIIIKIATK